LFIGCSKRPCQSFSPMELLFQKSLCGAAVVLSTRNEEHEKNR
jgi:hypothetical protein